MLSVNELSYYEIITAIRQNQVEFTAEFQPEEGRYFSTGHKKERCGHTEDVVFETEVPQDLICPICGKKMELGVKERCKQLQDLNISTRNRKSMYLIPLVEIIAHSLSIKNCNSQKVIAIFQSIMNVYPSEIALWQSNEIKELLDKRVPEKTVNQIIAVQNGNFSFQPPGFDGRYGKLQIGEKNGK